MTPPLVPLGEVCDMDRRGLRPDDPDTTRLPLLGVENVGPDTGVLNLDADSRVGAGKSTSFRFDARHVLYAKLRPYLNKVATPDFAGRCSTELVPLLPRPGVDRDFLACLLRRKETVAFVMSSVTGSRMPRTDMKALMSMPVPLPPLDEQRRIVDILNRAARIETLRTRAAERLREFGPALFVKMFGDPIENPMGWLREELGSLGTLDRGRSRHRPRNAPELYGGPYPFVQTGDIANSKGLVTEHSQTYSEVGLNQSRMWPAGTLCITIAANIAMTGILTFDSCFPDSVVGFQPGRTVTTEYVQTAVDLMQKQLQENAPRAAQRNINLNVLRGVNIPTPPLSLQRRYTEMIQATRGLAAVGESSKRTAATLMASLMCETCGSESSWSPHVGATDGYASAPRGRSFDQMP